MNAIPVIDLFAGPGGLAEGFSAWSGTTRFDVRLSVEMDPVACETLRLRKFFHLAKGTPARNSYYDFAAGKITLSDLQNLHQEITDDANSRVMHAELGNRRQRLAIHQKIHAAISRKDFVLVGGPPCQAYSIIGRSRRLGVGSSATDSNAYRNRKNLQDRFYEDPRHQLYREYLEIIAVHRPIAFVMENVKGLSSARTGASDEKGGMFKLIRSDLENPSRALEASISKVVTDEFGPLRKAKYKLFSLVERNTLLSDEPLSASEFVIQCENYGVPQTRHRIIIVGLREDIAGEMKPLSRSPGTSARDVLSDLPPLMSRISNSDEEVPGALLDELWRIPLDMQHELEIGRHLRGIRATAETLSSRRSRSRYEADSTPFMRWLHDQKLARPLQHEPRAHMPSDLVRYLFCAAFAEKYGRSPALEDWPTSLRPRHENIKTHRGKLKPTGFSDRFKVQGLRSASGQELPSSTVTSHIAKDGHYYIHFDPNQCRSLTVREAARLQSFPDNYFFCGTRTQQFHQVGNAVPPYVAKQIAGVLANAIGETF